jgi:hypothetical protein
MIKLKKNSFKEDYKIDFESDEIILERVLNGDFKKVYTLKDISKWVEYGLKNNMISKGNKKEDVDNIMKWIDLLGRKHIQI